MGYRVASTLYHFIRRFMIFMAIVLGFGVRYTEMFVTVGSVTVWSPVALFHTLEKILWPDNGAPTTGDSLT